jgi:hypothetical protein
MNRPVIVVTPADVESGQIAAKVAFLLLCRREDLLAKGLAFYRSRGGQLRCRRRFADGQQIDRRASWPGLHLLLDELVEFRAERRGQLVAIDVPTMFNALRRDPHISRWAWSEAPTVPLPMPDPPECNAPGGSA